MHKPQVRVSTPLCNLCLYKIIVYSKRQWAGLKAILRLTHACVAANNHDAPLSIKSQRSTLRLWETGRKFTMEPNGCDRSPNGRSQVNCFHVHTHYLLRVYLVKSVIIIYSLIRRIAVIWYTFSTNGQILIEKSTICLLRVELRPPSIKADTLSTCPLNWLAPAQSYKIIKLLSVLGENSKKFRGGCLSYRFKLKHAFCTVSCQSTALKVC